jgi:hypothetical protein
MTILKKTAAKKKDSKEPLSLFEETEAAPVFSEIQTLNGEKLIVGQDDPVFDAARSLFIQHGHANVMFKGEAGSGKTRRAEALTISENYPIFLKETPLSGIEVHIEAIELDLVQITANAEIFYDVALEAGNFSRHAAIVADFILTHGTPSISDFEKKMKNNQTTLEKKRGHYFIYLVMVDDFDRTFRELQNALLKPIHGVRHTFQKLSLKEPVRYLKLQCIATSNSSLGAPSGKYSAAAGRLDLAVANRFLIFHCNDPDLYPILIDRFPDIPEDCRLITQLFIKIKEKQADGELEALGEISLRQILAVLEIKRRYGLHMEAAASMLFSALPNTGDDREQADLLMARYFGRPANPDIFNFRY